MAAKHAADLPTFAENLRTARLSRGLEPRELAEQLHVSALVVRKLEQGELIPDDALLQTLQQHLPGLPSLMPAQHVFASDAEPLPPMYSNMGFNSGAYATRVGSDTAASNTHRDWSAKDAFIGQVIRGYEFKEQIGEGGFGSVYRATQLSLQRDVAIKVIKPELANDSDFVRRFEAEAELVARLENPHIVPLYDFWREPNAAFMVMRMLKGGSLAQCLRSEANARAPIRLLPMLRQISEALHAAHSAGVIHRDLKPANILLDEKGNACLADFGVAKQLNSDSGRTMLGEVVGSIAYCSPEQLRADKVSAASDIYALGIVAFELLAGRRPFSATQPALMIEQHLHQTPARLDEFVENAPPLVSALLAQCLQKDPADRPKSVLDFVHEFEAAIRGSNSNWFVASRVTLGDMSTPTTSVLTALQDQDNPYRGLASFDEGDAANFFGREALVEQILHALAADTPHRRALMVVGPSGSGKSSVVRAGVVPALKRGRLPGSDRWIVSTMLPGAEPLKNLAAALRRVSVRDADFERMLSTDSFSLARAIDRCLPNEDGIELLLVVDQFEELFTLCTDADARTQWIKMLTTAVLDSQSRLRVVLTLRADFLDRPLQFAELAELVSERTLLVPAMSLDELERAIVGPAKRLGLVFEEGLVSAILEEVKDHLGALPLLQYSLSELFLRRAGRVLRLSAFREMGGVKGALAGRAEDLFLSLPQQAQQMAQQLFLRLTALGEGSEDTRRRVRASELDALGQTAGARSKGDLDTVLTAFGSARLLTFDRDASTHENTVEVAHEALLRVWPRLREWLSSSRSALRLQRQLAEAASLWQQNGEDPSFLLSGNRLAQFISLLPNSGSSPESSNDVTLTGFESNFLQRSLDDQALAAAQESARQARELAQAQDLAKQQQRAAELAQQSAMEQRRGNVRLRWLSVGLAGILAVAVWQSLQIRQRSLALQQETLRANSEAKSASALSQFWQELFANADPNRARGRDLTVVDVLSAAAERLEASLKDAPMQRAQLLLTIAQTYRQLSDLDAAISAADAALNALSSATNLDLQIAIEQERGRILADQRETADAKRALESALALQKQVSASPLARATTLNILASVLNDERKHREAIEILREVLLLRSKNGAPKAEIASTANNLAFALRQTGKLAESLAMFENARTLRVEELGAEHIDVALTDINIADVTTQLGQFKHAEQALTQAQGVLDMLFPDSKAPHPAMFALQIHAATAAGLQKDWAKSKQILAEMNPVLREPLARNIAVLAQQAEIALAERNVPDALEFVSACLEQAQPQAARLQRLQARCLLVKAELLSAEQPEAAIDVLETALALQDVQTNLPILRAKLLTQLAQLDPTRASQLRDSAKQLLQPLIESIEAQALLKQL